MPEKLNSSKNVLKQKKKKLKFENFLDQQIFNKKLN